MENVKKEDLDLANHLVGLKQTYIKMSFLNMTDLQKVRKDLLSAVRKNKERLKNASAYQEMLAEAMASNMESATRSNPMENIIDLREYDLPLHVRASIDKSVFVGTWWVAVVQLTQKGLQGGRKIRYFTIYNQNKKIFEIPFMNVNFYSYQK